MVQLSEEQTTKTHANSFGSCRTMSFLHMTCASYLIHTHTYFHLFVFSASFFSRVTLSNTLLKPTRSSTIVRATYPTNSPCFSKIFKLKIYHRVYNVFRRLILKSHRGVSLNLSLISSSSLRANSEANCSSLASCPLSQGTCVRT